MSATTLTGKLITGGALLGVVVASLSAWGTYGWVTRSAYAQDHEGASIKTQQTAILKSLEAITLTLEVVQTDQVKNQDQWECDETDEELEEILEKEEEAGLSSSEKRDKTKLEEVWQEKSCSRFTD